MKRVAWLAGLLLLTVTVLGVANSAPAMDDDYVLTTRETATEIVLTAVDADIAVAMPDAHRMAFYIVAGPEHGILVGDLTDVVYSDPKTVSVALMYVPADEFLGTDTIHIEVVDPFGESDSAIVQIDVQEQRIPGVLAGNWTSEITYIVSPGPAQSAGFTAFRTMFTESYRIGALTLKSVASLQMEIDGVVKDMAFESLRFDGNVSMTSIDIRSTLSFDPDADVWADVFDYFLNTTRWSIGGLDLTHTWYVLNTQTDSYHSLNAAVNLGIFRLNSLTRFNLDPSCHYTFASNMSSLYWSWCDVPISAQLSITDAGFNYVQFRASSIPIERWAWLPEGLYVNTSLRFDLTSGKVFMASLGWRPTQIGCVEIFGELDLDGPGAGPVSGDTIIDGISIYGLRISCNIPGPYGDVRFVSATSFTDTKNSTVTGQSDYFEVIRLSGPIGSCCGYPGTWSVATYFNEDETSVLFDWGMTVISADVNISDHFTGYIETVFRSEYFDDPRMEITVGWTARW